MEEILHQLIWKFVPFIYRVSYMLVGAGFLLPSTVFPDVPPPSSSHRPDTFTFHCYGDYPNISPPKTNSSHMPGWRNPKGDSSSNPMCFRCELLIFREGTPQKINMDPKNHPIEKENPLPNLHLGFHVSFQGGYMFCWKTSPGSAMNCRTWSPHKRWCWYHHPVYVAKPS